MHRRYIFHPALTTEPLISMSPNSFYGTLMTQIKLIYTDQIRYNPFNLCHPCSILI